MAAPSVTMPSTIWRLLRASVLRLSCCRRASSASTRVAIATSTLSERVDKRGFVGGAELATCLDHSLELGALDATGTRHLQPVICSEVLAGVRHRVDRTSGLSALLAGDQGADENDPLTLLARDACPVVWVGGVREVLVLLELVHAGLEHMGDPQALLTDVQQVLDRHLLG